MMRVLTTRQSDEWLSVLRRCSGMHDVYHLPGYHAVAERRGDHQIDGVTVSINLLVTPAEQRAQYDGTVRNRLNRLARSDLNCELDVEQCHLSEFVALYHETMNRVQAERSYYFDATYFADLAKNLGPLLKLFV